MFEISPLLRLVSSRRLEDHVVLLAVHQQLGDAARTEQRLERAAHILDADAEIAGARAVHLDAQLRLGLLVVVVDRGQAGILRNAREQDVAPLRELLEGAAADHELQRFLEAPAEALRHGREGLHPGHVGDAPAHLRDRFPRRASPGVPVRQVEYARRRAVGLGARHAGRRAQQHALDVALLDHRHDAPLDVVDMAHRVLEGGTLRRRDEHEEGAAILAGCELRGNGPQQQPPTGEDRH